MNRKPRSRNNDLTGQRFTRWIVLGRAFRSKGHGSMWNCRCDCGTENIVSLSNLRAESSRSCGCLNAEQTGNRRRTHGESDSRAYHIWLGIKSRCHNPNDPAHINYGGRGIKVCDRWRGPDGYTNFVADLGHPPTPAHSIERKEVNGDYCPGNCCWIPKVRQNDNKRNSRNITFGGETKSIAAWARQYGIGAGALYYRLIVKKMPFPLATTRPLGKRRVYVTYQDRRVTLKQLAGLTGIDHETLYRRMFYYGDSVERMVRPVGPKRKPRLLTYKGITKGLREWSRTIGVDDSTIHARLKRGQSVEDALTIPSDRHPERFVHPDTLILRE